MGWAIAVGTLLSSDVGMLDAATADKLGAWLAFARPDIPRLICHVVWVPPHGSASNGAGSTRQVRRPELALDGASGFAAFILPPLCCRLDRRGARALAAAPRRPSRALDGGLAGPLPVPDPASSPFVGAHARASKGRAIAHPTRTGPVYRRIGYSAQSVRCWRCWVGIRGRPTQGKLPDRSPLLASLERRCSAIAMTILKWAMFLAPDRRFRG